MTVKKSYERLEENNASRNGESPQNDSSTWGKIKEKMLIFKGDGFKIIVGGCIVFSTALTIALVVDIYAQELPRGHGVVSSDSEICSKMGTDVIFEKGSAVDAAVAVAFCLSVVRFSSTGLTSGGYMLSHAPNGIDQYFDFQFTAPASASKDMFKGKQFLSERGGLAFAIPGFIKGLKEAHEAYGFQSWEKLVKKAVPLARDGFKIDAFTASKIDSESSKFSAELKDLLAPEGIPLKEGDVLKLPKLARVLDIIAEKGEDGFYSGDVAEEILKAANGSGGSASMDDMKNYNVVVKKPIFSDVGTHKVLTTSAPSSGPIALLGLKILDELNMKTNEKYLSRSYQFLAETFKFAFAQRTLLGDPKFVKPDVSENFIKKDFAKSISERIKYNETFAPDYYGPNFKQHDTKGTSGFSILGGNGDLVSFVSSLGSPFGSKIVTKSGIILNNGMGSFSSPDFVNIFGIEPSKANYIEPGKRPLSAAAPIVAFNTLKPCQNHIIISAGDNVKAITSTIQVLWNMLKFQDDASGAVSSPRIHHQLRPNILFAEGSRFKKAFLSHVLTDLQKYGHSIDDSLQSIGSVNVVAKTDDVMSGEGDSRTGASSVKI